MFPLFHPGREKIVIGDRMPHEVSGPGEARCGRSADIAWVSNVVATDDRKSENTIIENTKIEFY